MISIICCFTDAAAHARQISSPERVPTGPGKGAFSNPSRVSPQRTHVTVAGTVLRARVLDLRESEQLQETEVRPADVELVPLGLELGRVWIGVVVVVQLLAAKP